MLSGLFNHYGVSAQRTQITGTFLWTSLLVASNWSRARTEFLDRSHCRAASGAMGIRVKQAGFCKLSFCTVMSLSLFLSASRWLLPAPCVYLLASFHLLVPSDFGEVTRTLSVSVSLAGKQVSYTQLLRVYIAQLPNTCSFPLFPSI